MRLALTLATLVCLGMNATAASAQSRDWSLGYTHEQASVSTNDVAGTWTIDRFAAMWSRTDVGGWHADVERHSRYGVDDVAVRAFGYKRATDWTFAADAIVTPEADFLCRAGGGGEVSYRAVGTLVASGAYHFLQFPDVNIHQLEPALTWYRARGEIQGHLFLTRDATMSRTYGAALFRVAYDVTPRLRLGGGATIGDRIFNIDPLALGAASGNLAYGEARLGFTARDFILGIVTAAHEDPDFSYLSAALGYKRMF